MSDNQIYPICRLLETIKAAAKQDNRGMLAELRRGLSPSTQEYAWPHLISFCKDFENDDVRSIWCTVGGLSALFAKSGLFSEARWNNMGTVMNRIALDGNEKNADKALENYGAKFRRILSCGDVASLCETVIRVGRVAEKKNIPINPEILFWDLWNWRDPVKRDEVKLRWAKQYYAVRNDKTADGESKEEGNS